MLNKNKMKRKCVAVLWPHLLGVGHSWMCLTPLFVRNNRWCCCSWSLFSACLNMTRPISPTWRRKKEAEASMTELWWNGKPLLACQPWWQKDERITSAKALLFCSWLALDWVELNLWSADAFAFAPERSMITCGSTGSVMKPHRMYMWNRIDHNRMPSLIPNWGNLHNYSKQNVVQREGKCMLMKRKWK